MSYLEILPADLKAKIVSAIKANPESLDAFNSLFFYMADQQQQQDNIKESKRKKPKSNSLIQNDTNIGQESTDLEDYTTIFEMSNLSFQSPLRKKLTFRFAIKEKSEDKKPVILVINPILNKIEITIKDLSSQNIFFACFLPVIEKPKLQYLVMFYKSNVKDLLNNDPLIISFNQEQLITEMKKAKYIPENDGDGEKLKQSYKDRIINQAKICGFHIIDPFIHKNGINSFYVQAHKGTKEGTLYFLPHHVLFGFKKPVLLFHSSEIKTITYSSITRVTFNVTFHIEKDEITETVEFSMIDQSEYSKIDSYIQSKDVLNNSMAEELKAKPSKNENNIDVDDLEDQSGEDQGEENTGIQVGQGNVVEGDDEDDDDEDADFELNGTEDIDDTSDVSSMEDDD